MPLDDETPPPRLPQATTGGQFAAERRRLVAAMNECLDEAERLSGLLALCARCQQIGADDHARQVKEYLAGDAALATGTCAACTATCLISLPDRQDD
ncbi:MAG: hypothetical protein IPH44_18400 [Myxococcales bacterium]|nr:hypothetical protein [Myxococcales bacterium]MBK7196875.1 hypothetical protein [Myxococcales bacterium]MBP6843978.1 hypothetical protein [Kofleriaceae bacterium]